MPGCEGGGRQDAVPAVSEEPPRLGAGDLTHRVLLPGLPGIRLAQALPRQVIQNRYKCGTVKSPNFVIAHNFVTAADNFCEALLGFQL